MTAPADSAPAKPLPARAARAVFEFFFTPEAQLAVDAKGNWTYLVILLAILGLPFLFRFDPEAAGQSPKVFGVRLPGTCMSHELFGVDCPGCGLTRSFILIAHGRFAESMRFHRLGILLYSFFLLQAAYRVYCLAKGPRPTPRALIMLQRVVPAIIIFLLIANWIAGLCA